MANRKFDFAIDREGTDVETQLTTMGTKFGDGYEQVVSIGINNAADIFNISYTDTKAKVMEAYLFLLSTKGSEIFDVEVIPGEVKSVRCKASIKRTHIGGKYWRLTTTFEEAFGL